MFCANVSTKVEVVNLENDEIKSVLVMLVASYFLNKVTFGNLLQGYMYVSIRTLQYHVILYKSKFRFLISPFVNPM